MKQEIARKIAIINDYENVFCKYLQVREDQSKLKILIQQQLTPVCLLPSSKKIEQGEKILVGYEFDFSSFLFIEAGKTNDKGILSTQIGNFSRKPSNWMSVKKIESNYWGIIDLEKWWHNYVNYYKESTMCLLKRDLLSFVEALDPIEDLKSIMNLSLMVCQEKSKS